MGNQKQKWTTAEEEALLAGIAKHGPGKWKNILRDPEFSQFLTHRSNIDLKDKWRNLSVSTAAQGSRTKLPKLKALALPAPAAVPALTNAPNPAPAALPLQIVPLDTALGDPSHSATLDGKGAPRYNALILDALTHISNPVGADINLIVQYLEKQGHGLLPNLRRSVGSKLRRLVQTGKLEKIQNCYRIKTESPALGGRTSPNKLSKERAIRPFQQGGGAIVPLESVEQAASVAASRVVEAENKAFVAAEAVKEAERVSKLAEETDAMLMLVEEIYEQCARGEIVMLA